MWAVGITGAAGMNSATNLAKIVTTKTSSGNSPFDDYRGETLKRLEDEQIEFESFLERLRHAKDKAEFDQFMDNRSAPTEGREKPEGAADNPTN